MAMSSIAKRLFFAALLAGVFFGLMGLSGALITWITLKSSIQGEIVEVPDLFGMTEQDAQVGLETVGLTMAVDRSRVVHSDLVPAGKVFLQVPAPGKKIKTGRVIEITLSSGPDKKLTPRLKGESLGFARTLLKEEINADASVISRIPQRGELKGRVLSQWPAAGDEIGVRQGASLLVADGEPMPYFVMPDLAGKDYLSVKAFLDKAGLRHMAKYRAEDDDLGQVILDQAPMAGFPVNRARVITLTINKDF